MKVAVKMPIVIRQSSPADGASPGEYERFEAEIVLDRDYFCHEREGGETTGLSPGHIFDAYDADTAGERIAVDATFTRIHYFKGKPQRESLNVPGFVMKEAANGPWHWRVRFAPPAAGRWTMTARAVTWHTADCHLRNYDEKRLHLDDLIQFPKEHPFSQVPMHNHFIRNGRPVYYHYLGYEELDEDPNPAAEFDPITGLNANHHSSDIESQLPKSALVFNVSAPGVNGAHSCMRPLRRATETENSMYFYRDGADGKAEPVFLSGASMAWTSRDWEEYLGELQKAGCNFNSFWFAPWETMLVHASNAVQMQKINVARKLKEVNLQTHEEWNHTWAGKLQYDTVLLRDESYHPWSYYDQGRAQWMDRILDMHRSYGIYFSLCIWPHPALKTFDHEWIGQRHWRSLREQYKDIPFGEEAKTAATEGRKKVEGTEFETSHWEEERTWNGFASLPAEAKRQGNELLAQARIASFLDVGNSRFWGWQRNLYRYIVARWGWDPCLVFWGVVAEVEGVGTSMNYWTDKKDHTHRWLVEVMRALNSLDCYRAEDPRVRPVSAWSMSWMKGKGQQPYGGNPRESQESSPPEDHGMLSTTQYAVAGGQVKTTDYARTVGIWSFDAYPTVHLPVGLGPVSSGSGMWSNHSRFADWIEDIPSADRFTRLDLGLPRLGESRHYALWRYFVSRPVEWVWNLETARKAWSTEPLIPPRPFLLTEFGATEYWREIRVRDKRVRGKWYQTKKGWMQARTVRSYIHYTLWSALASGHCGTPLRWFDNDLMHPVFDELKPVVDVFSELRQKGLWDQLKIRISSYPYTEPSGNIAYGHPVPDKNGICWFGLRSERGDKLLIW
ncbi:MAG: DUF5060 domain-containing protein, partial [Spirochaetaceae bacterium]|nr:DUF5060 domain-containing protein [Spirochaetaceae bacterium]